MVTLSCFLPAYYTVYYQLLDINVMRSNVVYVLEEKKKKLNNDMFLTVKFILISEIFKICRIIFC